MTATPGTIADAPAQDAVPTTAPRGGGRVRRFLALVGRRTRARSRFLLTLMSVAWSVVRLAAVPSTWRRTVRVEFWRVLNQAAGGGLGPVVVIAALVGVGVVAQALYWLGLAGQEGLIGSILSVVVAREIAPVLVGMILLGRSGTVATVELGGLSAGGQVRALAAMGVDPFLVLVLPRAVAMAVAGFALGVAFIVVALAVGWTLGTLTGSVAFSALGFGDRVLRALSAADFLILPGKMLLIGLLVALTAMLTGMQATSAADTTRLLPVAFARGALAILLTSGALSLAA